MARPVRCCRAEQPARRRRHGGCAHARIFREPRRRTSSAVANATHRTDFSGNHAAAAGLSGRCGRRPRHHALPCLTAPKAPWLSRPHAATPHHRQPDPHPGHRRGVAARTRAYYRTHRCGTSWRVAGKGQIRSKTPHRPRCGVFRFQHPFQLKPCSPPIPPRRKTPPAMPCAPPRRAWRFSLPRRPPRPDATAVFFCAPSITARNQVP